MRECSITSISRSPAPTPICRISTGAGSASLDAYCRKTHNAPFVRLAAAQQDEVITALEQGKATGFTWPTAQAFFNTVRTHTMEGMFADPIYGGNKDFAGWRPGGLPRRATSCSRRRTCRAEEAFTRCPHHRPASAGPNAEGMSHGNRKD